MEFLPLSSLTTSPALADRSSPSASKTTLSLTLIETFPRPAATKAIRSRRRRFSSPVQVARNFPGPRNGVGAAPSATYNASSRTERVSVFPSALSNVSASPCSDRSALSGAAAAPAATASIANSATATCCTLLPTAHHQLLVPNRVYRARDLVAHRRAVLRLQVVVDQHLHHRTEVLELEKHRLAVRLELRRLDLDRVVTLLARV